VALLEKLAARGVPLYCLFEHILRFFCLPEANAIRLGAFRGIVISGDLQIMKPEREIFEFLLQRYGLVAAQTVFIDDNAPNVAAARDVGIHGVWFKNARQCELELEELLASP